MHNFPKTINQLFDLQKFSIKMDLENITYLCQYLDNPQLSYPTIHVAGTNGKGSTSMLIQSILATHGVKVGLYTSPHLVDFRERIRINNDLIDEQFICLFWSRIKSTVRKIKATFFDTTTVLAFTFFRDNNIDLAVVETGLGGRLDSTNILKPIAAVITPIDVDHIKQLGTEVKSIAKEKAAIVKEGSILISGHQQKNVESIIASTSKKSQGFIHLTKSIKISNISSYKTSSIFDIYDIDRSVSLKKIKLNMAGRYQIDNASLAYLCSRWYLDRIARKFSQKKLQYAFKNISWPGRLQRVFDNPEVFFDVSHNFAGFKATMDFIRLHFNKGSLHLLIGLLEDKQYELIINLIHDCFNQIVITEPINDRKLSAERIHNEFSKYGINTKIIKDINKAFEFSLINTPENHTLFVMGSHFLIGKLLSGMHKKHLT
jgi:dihydrofolate synthase/folylpolyglutamate synthase